MDFEFEFDALFKPGMRFDFLLDSHALRLPFDYRRRKPPVLAPSGTTVQNGRTSCGAGAGSPRPTVEAIVAMNSWLHENIGYERREEGDAFSPKETLERQAGSCRDFAVLLAEVLRAHGLAVRLASGYLWEDESGHGPKPPRTPFTPGSRRILPGAGWLALDPTNGVLCDHHFLATAVGLSAARYYSYSRALLWEGDHRQHAGNSAIHCEILKMIARWMDQAAIRAEAIFSKHGRAAHAGW